MRAATTKIPHLLYEKDLLKKPEYNVWFYLKFMIYLQWKSWWEWEKKLKYNKTKSETKEKNFPVWLPPPPRLRNGGRLFSGVRKQAGPTLGGLGVLV